MTVGVDDELRIREYPGDNTATPRAYGFKILDPDDLRVTRTNADRSETVLVRGTDYSVSGAGNPSGGNVTPLAPIAAGTSWRIEGDMSLGQPTDYTAGDDFPAESHERGLDRSMIAHQEARRDINDVNARAMLVPRGETSPTIPPLAERRSKFWLWDVDGNPFTSFGTGADQGFRQDAAQGNGAALFGFQQDADGAVLRSLLAKVRDSISVKDFGAIGDGASHPVSQWLVGGAREHIAGYETLADIQADFPDVRTLADEIDYAAINAAVRFGAANSTAVRIPAGLYLAWIYAHANGVVILGDGSDVTTIRVPAGALRETPNNNDGSGPWVEGAPCVVEFNPIGNGNDAPARSGGHISGLTLDGNAANTDVPELDLHGWGLAFTAYSDVTYSDIYVINTHCGGVGTFINSNYHIGSSRSYNCGHSDVDGATRPGFDVNSSKYSLWNHVSENDAYGGRIIDNCFGCKIAITVNNATRSGFVYGNQTVNFSHSNVIDATVNGGCLDSAFQVGGDCSATTVRVTAQGVTGDTFRTVAAASPDDDSRANSYTIASRRAGGRCAYIQGSNDRYFITSAEDGRGGPQGGVFAIDVEGDKNIIDATLTDTSPWHVRGLAFRAGSSNNILLGYTWTNTADPFSDLGTDNIWRDRTPVWTAPALLNGFANVGGDYFNVGYYKDANGWVHLRGLVNGGTAGNSIFLLPAGFRPVKHWTTAFAGGAGAGGAYKLQVGSGGDVVPAGGADFFSLDGISFPTKS